MTKKVFPFLIICYGGNPKVQQTIINNEFFLGARLPSTNYYPLFFADQEWENPNFDKYLEYIQKERPYMATVVDITSVKLIDTALLWADKISKYVDKIVIIPKINEAISHIPHYINGKEIILGYSVPTKYGKTDIPIDNFSGYNIHLLGGSPKQQMELFFNSGQSVYSIDNNYVCNIGLRFGGVWNMSSYSIDNDLFMGNIIVINQSGLYVKWHNGSQITAIDKSLSNLMSAWNMLFSAYNKQCNSMY